MGGRLRRRGADLLCPPPSGAPRLSPTNNLRTWCEENGREDLMEEWDDPTKGPEDVTRASHAKVQWKCGKVECGWTWIARVADRTKSKGPTGCPACAGRVATPTHNLEAWCKANGREDLLEEWVDAGRRPKDFTPASKVKVPWKCGECGCGWDATIANRTKSNGPSGCPACNIGGKKTVSGAQPRGVVQSDRARGPAAGVGGPRHGAEELHAGV